MVYGTRRLTQFLVAAALTAATMHPDQTAGQSVIQAEELPDLVVTATRVPTSPDRIGSSITVITAEEIEEKQQIFVGEALRGVPGVAVGRTGGVGNVTQARIRGSEGNHTLVLIDGMEVNDIGFNSEFDFGNLLTDGIERIEVLRGPQSTLWGGDAMGGVINIVTKRGDGPPSASALIEGGSFQTGRASASLSGRADIASYSLTAARYQTHGTSNANEANGNRETDGYRNNSFLARLGFDINDWLTLEGVGRFRDSNLETDPQTFNFVTFLSNQPADGETESEGIERQGLIKATAELFDGRFQAIVSAQSTENDRRNITNGLASFNSEGKKRKLDFQGNVLWNERNTLVFGAETEEEKIFTTFQAKSDVESQAYFLQYLLTPLPSLDLSGGVRRDQHQSFGDEDTYRVTASYLVERTSTRLKASYGTGFKAPTLGELFGFFGNRNLQPETNEGWDAGFVQDLWGGRVRAEIAYFDNQVEDLIVFTAGGLVNLSEVDTNGVEVGVGISVTPELDLNLFYTYTNSADRSAGRERIRNPRHRVGFDAAWRFAPNLKATLAANYTSEQDDFDFSQPLATRQITLQNFTKVDVGLAYRVSDRYEVYGRIENLLDEDYEEVIDYGTPGIAGYAGIRARF